MNIITVDGIQYDITSYIKHHPGGESILKFWINKDATLPFLEFHRNNFKATYVLKKLPKPTTLKPLHKPLPKPLQHSFTPPHQNRFLALRKTLYKLDFYKTNEIHAFKRLLELIILYTISIFFLRINYILFSILTFGWFGSRCGWVQHECGHRSFLGLKYDPIIHPIIMGLGLSSSSDAWNVHHNKHHSALQVEGWDTDLKTIPFVCFNSKLLPAKISFFIRYQYYTFFLLTCPFITMNYWLYYSHWKFIIRRGNLGLDGKCMLISHTLIPLIISYLTFSSFAYTYFILWLSKCLTSFHLFSNFALSHSHTELSLDNSDWVESALNHTVDIDPRNHYINYYMGFLNCQTVHHLFPTIPHFKHPIISEILKEWCKDNNLTYTVISYREAWTRNIKNLKKISQQH